MPVRYFPLQPNLEQLKHQAKDLLKAIHAGDPEALADLAQFHPSAPRAEDAKLADAQLVLARSYEASSWPRLVQACELVTAIWDDDPVTVRRLIEANPQLLHESATIRNSHWGPPMSFAANLGRDRIIRMLYEMGARDLEHAFDRAALQSKVSTAAMIHEWLGRRPATDDDLGGPAYTLSDTSTEFLFRLGARVRFDDGRQNAPVETVIGSDSRNPAAKRRILAMYAEHGYVYPDTPVMAFHRGLFDDIERHLAQDPALLERQFPIEQIFPPELGCKHPPYQAMGTPVDGGTLLHLAVYWDEMDMMEWLLAHGADVNARAAVDADGYGGHTPLFNAVVGQANFWMNYRGRGPQVPGLTGWLLEHGAEPNVRASIRMRLGQGHGETHFREVRDVTPLGWAQRMIEDRQGDGKYPCRIFVSEPGMRAIAGAGGVT